MNNDIGKIIGVNGQIVEVEFKTNQPNIHDLLLLENDPSIKMEVFSSKDNDRFFCLNLSSNSQISRGLKVVNTKKPLTIAVGQNLLGRVIDIFGNPLDGLGEIKKTKDILPIYRNSPDLSTLVYQDEILETGIKALDIFSPIVKGGNIGIFGGAGVGKNVLFFVDNIFRFAQAGNELSILMNTIPSEDGYQATLTSEMASFHERLT